MIRLLVTFVCVLSVASGFFHPSIARSKRICLRSVGSDQDGVTETFYSPNVEIDDSRYRYDLESDEFSDSTEESENAAAAGVNEYSFFDEAIIYVRAGSGGQGASTYKKGKGGQDGPADGGNGGNGGDIMMVVDDSLNTLAGE